MNKTEQELYIETLLARGELQRQLARQHIHRFSQSIQPTAIKTDLIDYGVNRFNQVMPSAQGVFSLLQQYPYMSVSIARSLLKLATSRNRFVRPLALGLAAWFIYNRFKK